MYAKWEAQWKGERVYVEIEESLFEKFAKGFTLGILRAKMRCLLQYGNQVVERRAIKIPIIFDIPSIDLIGTAIQSDGQEVHLHARITPTLFLYYKCELKINSEKVEVEYL